MQQTPINCPGCQNKNVPGNLHIRSATLDVLFVSAAKTNAMLVQCTECQLMFRAEMRLDELQQLHIDDRSQFLIRTKNEYGIFWIIVAFITLPIGLIGLGCAWNALDTNPFPGGRRTTAKILIAISAIITILMVGYIIVAIANRPDTRPIFDY